MNKSSQLRQRLERSSRDELIDTILKLRDRLKSSGHTSKSDEQAPGQESRPHLMKEILYASLHNTPMGMIIWEVKKINR